MALYTYIYALSCLLALQKNIEFNDISIAHQEYMHEIAKTRKNYPSYYSVSNVQTSMQVDSVKRSYQDVLLVSAVGAESSVCACVGKGVTVENKPINFHNYLQMKNSRYIASLKCKEKNPGNITDQKWLFVDSHDGNQKSLPEHYIAFPVLDPDADIIKWNSPTINNNFINIHDYIIKNSKQITEFKYESDTKQFTIVISLDDDL
jgi:hypothetical protein